MKRSWLTFRWSTEPTLSDLLKFQKANDKVPAKYASRKVFFEQFEFMVRKFRQLIV